jgi:biotin carboxylase
MNAPFYTSVESFVNSNGGNHAITKILIANNGIGAIKAIRSIRRWSFEVFGHEKKVNSNIFTADEKIISTKFNHKR